MENTIRAHLNQAMSKHLRGTFLAWITFAACAVAGIINPKFQMLAFLPLVVFMALIIRAQFGGIRCPKCGVNLFQTMFYPRMRFSLKYPPEFKFCPGCGTSMDAKLE